MANNIEDIRRRTFTWAGMSAGKPGKVIAAWAAAMRAGPAEPAAQLMDTKRRVDEANAGNE
jgi:hypothetical protein